MVVVEMVVVMVVEMVVAAMLVVEVLLVVAVMVVKVLPVVGVLSPSDPLEWIVTVVGCTSVTRFHTEDTVGYYELRL